MSSPKKRLPTGPIRIENAFIKNGESDKTQDSNQTVLNSSEILDSFKIDSRKQDSGLAGNCIVETGIFEARLTEVLVIGGDNSESRLPDSGKREIGKQDSGLVGNPIASASYHSTQNTVEYANNDSSSLETIRNENTKQDSRKQDYAIPESSSLDSGYKKVAMRLSVNSFRCLQSIRTETGLPYEVMVDVMIRNWEGLPTQIKHEHIAEAREIRLQRLIEGQDKAMKTVRKKLRQ
jgi:hypothetical protein